MYATTDEVTLEGTVEVQEGHGMILVVKAPTGEPQLVVAAGAIIPTNWIGQDVVVTLKRLQKSGVFPS